MGGLEKPSCLCYCINMKTKRSIFCIVVASALLLANSLPAPQAAAYTQKDLNEINTKINKIKGEMKAYENQASAYAAEANTIQGQINSLRAQQNTLRKQIELREAERERLAAEIEATTKRINNNSETVGFTIAQFYYNSEITTIERIASADSFSSFIDEEMQLSGITDTLAAIIEENKNLKEELSVKKKNAERIIKDLDGQRAQLASLEAQQQNLLAQARQNEASFRKMRSEANSQRAALEAQQRKIIADLAARYNAGAVVAGDPNKGGYPYSNRCPQQQDWFSDSWGMFICECVSYAAWRVYNAYGYMPYWGGRGNANQWISSAISDGYKVSSVPRAGTVGISMSGPWGHAVWVEAVSGNRVYVSQYNYPYAGEYSEQWVDSGMYQYIYFGK